MHEFSLASEIVDMVEQAAKNAGKGKVTCIELEIGELAGVEESALLIALESLTLHSMSKGAQIITKNTKGKAICSNCNFEYELQDLFTLCPKCSGFRKQIISGKEFNILSIEAE
ncbi:MAG: hydrogenase maturation nickel metallochaperone HypA [Bacteroidota bacterium]|nr:MAG: hydrogenase maturation nickel metallochaperone HypA [Bacteroidota bacterium]